MQDQENLLEIVMYVIAIIFIIYFLDKYENNNKNKECFTQLELAKKELDASIKARNNASAKLSTANANLSRKNSKANKNTVSKANNTLNNAITRFNNATLKYNTALAKSNVKITTPTKVTTPTIIAPPSGSNTSMSSLDQIFLDEHNKYRTCTNQPLLTWDPALKQTAQAWANYEATTGGCQMFHTPANLKGTYQTTNGRRSGQNLGWTSSSSNPTEQEYIGGLKRMLKSMFNEHVKFNPKNPEANWHDFGHFSQMTWKNTTKVGCAASYCNNKIQYVCHFDVQQTAGAYGANINAPVKSC